MKSNSKAEKKNIFEIVNASATKIDEVGKLTKGDGARFTKLAEVDQWLLKMNFEFEGQKDDEWYDKFDIAAVEYSGVGFSKWNWRHTVNGWACKAYQDADGWVLNKDLKGPAE